MLPTSGAARLVVATAIAQALALVAAPLLSRLYSPTAFGLFASIAAVSAWLATVGTLRYELLVPVQGEESEAVLLSKAATWSSIVIAALAFIALSSWAGWLPREGVKSVMPFAALAAFSGLSLAQVGIATSLALRMKNYKASSRATVAQAAGQLVVQVGLAAVGFGASGLALGQVSGQLLGVAVMRRAVRLSLSSAADRQSMRAVVGMARAHSSYARNFTLAAAVNSATLNLPVLIIASSTSLSYAGYFGLAQRLLAAPLNLLGAALGRVYVAEAAAGIREGNASIERLFVSTVVRLAAVGAAVCIVTIIGAERVTALVFGSTWSAAGRVMAILAPAAAVQLVVSPVSQTTTLLGMARLQLAFDVCRFALVVGGLLVVGSVAESAVSLTAFYSAATTVAYIGIGLFLWREIKKRVSSPEVKYVDERQG